MTDRSAQPPGVSLRLLGDPAVQLADGSVRALERRAAGLLALVALEPGVTRARAAALLWPQSDDGRKALRQQLLRFRRLFGIALVSGDDALELAEGIVTDLETGVGPLLGALGFEECEAFADWLARQRAARRGAQVEPLLQRLAQAESERDFERGLTLAEQLLAIEPDSEAHQRSVIRLHYLRGDLAQAQAGYDRLRRRLRTRFGTMPSAETEALAQLLRHARDAGGALAKTTAAAVAVQTPAALLRPPRLVGRERELAALQAAWQAQRAVLLLGEPGLGKSRLLGEFAQGQRVLAVQARPGDAGVPYALLTRLLRLVLERCTVEIAPSQRGELARLLPELAPGMPRPAEGQRLLLQRAIEAALAHARLEDAPLVGVLVDDLHFADEASVEMLQSLVGATEPGGLRWALARRPGEGGAAAAALGSALQEAGTLTALQLAPLDEPALAELVGSLGMPELDTAALAGALARHTGGNPLFALETLKLGLRSGQLRDGRLPQPDSVGALIELRLGQLSPRALALARLAAIAGVDFGIALAERVTGERVLALTDAWRELQSAQVLRDTAFAHDLVADAVLRQVPEAIARHLHADIARWLDERGAEPARRALHWKAAGDDPRSLDALVAAAQRAMALGRDEEAGQFRIEASAACDRLGRAEEAFDHLFEGINLFGGFMPADRIDVHTVELERRARTPAQRAAALLVRNHVHDLRGQWREAMACVAEGLPLARAAGNTELEAQLLFAQGKMRYNTGDLAGARAPVTQAIELMEAAGRPDYAADKLTSLATIEEALGNLRASDAHLTRARRLQAEHSSFGTLQKTLGGQAMTRIQLGDGAGTRAVLDEEPQRLAHELRWTHSDDQARRQHLKLQLISRVHIGDLAIALQLYRDEIQGTAHERDPGVAAMSAWLLHHLGRNDLARPLWQHALREGVRAVARAFVTIMQVREDPSQAVALWEGREELASFGDCLSHSLLNGYLAPLAPGTAALRALERLTSHAREHELIGHMAGLLAARALVRARAGESTAAAQSAAEAEEFLNDVGIFSAPWVWHQCFEAYRLAGHPADARRCANAGARWVSARAETLPVEFREAFERRVPAHQWLLAHARHSP